LGGYLIEIKTIENSSWGGPNCGRSSFLEMAELVNKDFIHSVLLTVILEF